MQVYECPYQSSVHLSPALTAIYIRGFILCQISVLLSLCLTTFSCFIILCLAFRSHLTLSQCVCRRSCGLLSVSIINTDSAAYLMLLRLWPSIMYNGRSSYSVRIAPLCRLNKSGVNTHHCFRSLSTFVQLLNSFFICMHVVCCQYVLCIILIFFSIMPWLPISSISTLRHHLHPSAFVLTFLIPHSFFQCLIKTHCSFPNSGLFSFARSINQ